MEILNRVKVKLYRSAFSAAGKAGSCKIENTIVVAGSPRSGTTLLLEVLFRLPGYKALNEPLFQHCTQIEHGFEYRSYLPQDKFSQQQINFLDKVLRGQMNSSARWLFEAESRVGRIIEHSSSNKLVVKFCRINRMLPQFTNQFNLLGTVFIVRHPCAVINSMLRFGVWDNWNSQHIKKSLKDPSSSIYIQHLPDEVKEVFNPVLNRIKTKTEALAMIWCLDHYLPLIYSNHHPWILVFYEELVKHNKQELSRITEALGIKINDEMHTKMNSPSSSVKGKLHKDPDVQLSKWKHQLTSRQIDNILSIVDETGLSRFYSDSIEPIYQQHSVLQKNI